MRQAIVVAAIVLLLLISNKVSAEKIIAQFEGLRLRAYQDTAGVWTIGYGTTKNPDTGQKIKEGDTITKAKALDWLKKDTAAFKAGVEKLVKVPVNDNQLAALTSLAYNIGLTAFSRSTLLRYLNSNVAKEQVAAQFLRWNRSGGQIVRGLTIRRKLESDLFLT
jgi:lysozyme